MKEALAKAEAQGKKVFVDCYTKTCGPCKYMIRKIFPLKVCGDYFNRHYVCITRDMEEGEGTAIARDFKVYLCPTYLILNTDGTLFARLDGGAVSSPEEDFVGKVKAAVRLGGMHAGYAAGQRDEAFLKEYRRLMFEKDRRSLGKVMDETMLSCKVKELAEPENWQMIREAVTKPTSPLFQYLVRHRRAFIRELGRQEVETKIMHVYSYDFRMNGSKDTDYTELHDRMSQLAEEGYPEALPLEYAILCRKICQEQDGREIDRLTAFLPRLGDQVPDSRNRIMLIKEIGSIHPYCTPEQKKDMIEALNGLLPLFEGRNAATVQKLILDFGR